MYGLLSDAVGILPGSQGSAGQVVTGAAALRAVVVYGFTLLIVRLGNKRMMGKATAFDVILGVMIGSVMSRGINSAEAMAPTLAAGSVLVAVHWLFGIIAYHTLWFGNLVKGKPVKLIENGEVREEAMRGSSVSKNDLAQAIRQHGMHGDPSRVALAYLERDGNISVIPRSHDAP